MKKTVKLFLVDDDALLLKSMEIQLKAETDYEIQTFASGEECILKLNERPDLVVLDYHLDGINPSAMNGIETLDKIKAFDPNISVIMLSSQDKIEVAVDCMHHHASDYVVKSETAIFRLQKIMIQILEFRKTKQELNWYMEKM